MMMTSQSVKGSYETRGLPVPIDFSAVLWERMEKRPC
jgi:hypothetical protein